jgi:pimeloyl-ACP methyl ester carboxylesterase
MALSARQKSTNVQSISTLPIRALDRTAPRLAARLVHEQWFRLPATTLDARREAGNAAPNIRELLASPFEVVLRGHVVRGWAWGSGPVVYLVHGWAGNLEQLTRFVAPLVDRGLQPVAFDGLGHGRSDPGLHRAGTSDAVELGRSLDAVAARFGPARAVVAHSMGALSTLLALRDGWVGAERLAFVAPFPGVPDLADRLRTDLRLGPRTMRRVLELAERRTGYDPRTLDLAAMATQVERPDLLVVHDLLDREAPHARSVELVAGWPGAQLLSTVALGHRRILADAAVAGAVARFADRLPVEPSLHGDETPAPWPFVPDDERDAVLAAHGASRGRGRGSEVA